MPSMKELLEQKAAIEREIERQRQVDRSAALDEIKAVMDKHGLSVSDVQKMLGSIKAKAGQNPPVSGAGKKVAAKYKDPATGNQWTGRGLRPKWLVEQIEAGKKLEDFLIK